MLVRPCAEFRADFPDDQIEDEHDIVEFGGRGVAEALAGILRTAGYDVSAPEHQHEKGWDFEVTQARRRVWILVTNLEDFILQTKVYGSVFTPNGNDAFHAEVLTRLNDGMAADGRFTVVQWFRQAELLSGGDGAATPVDG